MHEAARNGHADALDMMLHYGGDCMLRDHAKMNPLDLAAEFGREEVSRANRIF